MLVSIVILNWNRKQDTLNCLKSLIDIKKYFELEVIIIDNYSKDGSLKDIRWYLKNSPFKKNNIQTVLIRNKANLGFCGGNNVGIRHALNHQADYILLLNNDTYVDRKFLINLIMASEKHSKAGILSPKIYFAPGFEFKKQTYDKKDLGKVIWYAGGEIDWNNVYGFNHGVDQVDGGQFDKIVETDFATGACMLIKREVLEEIGLLDEKYFMYFEDNDLGMRAKRKGWRVLFVPDAVIWHKVSQSSKIGGPLNDYYITRNRLIFGMKYASLRTKYALVRESLRMLKIGREWQKKAVLDFYLCRFGKGSWK